MWWERRGQTAEVQLVASLEDQVSFLRSELDPRTRETERLHDLLAQKEQTVPIGSVNACRPPLNGAVPR
jgi:hypothetical protein